MENQPSTTTVAANTLSVRFTGTGSEYFQIWIVNLLLMLVTLGIYYPWARVRRLKYFASHTEVDGHPLDFHGQGQQLFLGFTLAALALFTYMVSQQLVPVLALGLFALYALVWPWLFRAAHRFRLARTSWRGLNFGFTGSLPDAYRAIGPPLLFYLAITIVTYLASPDFSGDEPELNRSQQLFLNIAPLLLSSIALLLAPLVYYLFKRYQHNNFAYASVQTQFRASLRSFYKLFGKTLIIAVLVFGTALMLAIAAVFAIAGISWGSLPGLDSLAGVSGLLLFSLGLIAYVVIFTLASFVSTYFQSGIFNLVWNNTAGNGIAFAGNLSFTRLLGVKMINTLLVMLTLGLYIPFAKVALARLKLDALSVTSETNVASIIADVRSGKISATTDSAADLLDIDIGL